MPENTSNPPESLPDAPHVSAPAADGNATPPNQGLSLEDINTMTGRNYATIEDARKGIDNTYKFVGQPRPAAPAAPAAPSPSAVIPEGYVSRTELDKMLFYRDNPEYKKQESLIEALAAKNRISPQEVVKGEEYKGLAGLISKGEEAERTASVLHSNPRLGIVRDSENKARDAFELAQKARLANDPIAEQRYTREAESQAMKSVLDAFPDLKGNTIVP